MKKISVTVNGRKYTREVSGHKTLLHFIRDDIGLTGTKEGCAAGECGACTIILNGRTVNSCLVLAVEADKSRIETVEGESKNGSPSKLQKSFEKHHAAQCGFCTPGMIMSTKYLMKKHPRPTEHEVREGIEGNFCRCTGYKQIIEAIQDANGLLKKQEELKRVR